MNQEQWLAERRRLGLPADPAKDFPPNFREEPGATARRHGSASGPGSNRSSDPVLTALQAEQRRLAEAARRAAQLPPGTQQAPGAPPRPAQPAPGPQGPVPQPVRPANVAHQYRGQQGAPPARNPQAPLPQYHSAPFQGLPANVGAPRNRAKGAGCCVVLVIGFILVGVISFIAFLGSVISNDGDQDNTGVESSYGFSDEDSGDVDQDFDDVDIQGADIQGVDGAGDDSRAASPTPTSLPGPWFFVAGTPAPPRL